MAERDPAEIAKLIKAKIIMISGSADVQTSADVFNVWVESVALDWIGLDWIRMEWNGVHCLTWRGMSF